jgi:hypothetical protein
VLAYEVAVLITSQENPIAAEVAGLQEVTFLEALGEFTGS